MASDAAERIDRRIQPRHSPHQLAMIHHDATILHHLYSRLGEP
jgi:hypothetical protein